MRTTYIHIGMHKTGTTSIQWALNRHREALEQRGFLYPRAGVPAQHDGHHNIGWELYGGAEFRAGYGSTDDLLEEIGASDRNVVLSSELFGVAAHNPERFASFIARLKAETPRVVIIVYLRSQSGYARSLYFELLKHEYRETFDTFLSTIIREKIVHLGEHSRYSFCYRDFLALLPSDAEIAVRLYDRTKDGSAVADFLSVLGLTPSDLHIDAEPRVNFSASLDVALAAFYRNRRGRELPVDVQPFLGKNADLSPASRQRIVAAFDASNQDVNARFTNCALACVAMESPATVTDLHLENLFSEATLHLLDYVAERETALDTAVASRDAAMASRNTILAERGEFANKYESAAAERDAVTAERDAVTAERDAVTAERDAVTAERDAVTAERDAILRSRSWRITAPLRKITKFLQRSRGADHP